MSTTDTTDRHYVPAEPPPRPFKKGDRVEVLDREHTVLSVVSVQKVTRTRVVTDCGRWWNLEGCWLGEDGAYQWPSIRLIAP